MSADGVDYAVPADVPSSRRRERRSPAPADGLWGGRSRTLLKVGSWVLAAALGLALLVPLLVPDEHGASSPEAAVAQLVQGIADVDPVAVVAVLDPAESADPERAQAAYDRMSGRLLRRGEVPPAEVTAMLDAVEGQVDDDGDLTSVATLAALDLELEGLELRTEGGAGGTARVHVLDGALDVSLDPDRLAGSGEGLGRASYTMPVAEGWRRDRRVPVEPFLVTVERDGRWYVSLEESADALLGATP